VTAPCRLSFDALETIRTVRDLAAEYAEQARIVCPGDARVLEVMEEQDAAKAAQKAVEKIATEFAEWVAEERLAEADCAGEA